jgi:hypothetical protein
VCVCARALTETDLCVRVRACLDRDRSVCACARVHFEIDLRSHDLVLLEGNRWVNDTIVTAYLALLEIRQDTSHSAGVPCLPRCAFINSQYWDKAQSSAADLQQIRLWIAGFVEDCVGCRLVLFPLNIPRGSHWILLAADMEDGTITYYNSYHMQDGSHHPVCRTIAGLLEECFKGPRAAPAWRYELRDARHVPEQTDAHNCALFAMAMADCVSAGRPVGGYSQSTMPAFRLAMRQLFAACQKWAPPKPSPARLASEPSAGLAVSVSAASGAAAEEDHVPLDGDMLYESLGFFAADRTLDPEDLTGDPVHRGGTTRLPGMPSCNAKP